MLMRLLMLGIVCAAAVLGLYLWRQFLAWRVRRLQAADVPPSLAARVERGRPNLLYFTTANCAQCRYQQTPILNQLAVQVNVAIHKLDAVEQEALARFYGIMTVPTTVVLGEDLRPVAVNHGLTPLPRLRMQLGAGRSENT